MNPPLGVVIAAFIVNLAASRLPAAETSRLAAYCTPIVVAVDTVGWDGSAGTFLGRAVGQSFYAPARMLRKLTLWRPAYRAPGGGHLFITEVDSSLTPPRPNTRAILHDGLTLNVPDSDPPGQLVEMPFVFDPPLQLPRPGMYAWFVQTEFCDPGEIRFVGHSDNPYPYGNTWLTGRALSSCFLAPVADGVETADYAFRLEFCDSVTPVRSRSWGQLKMHYR